MTNLTNKTVVITGASQGIGASTARVFASAGANVVLTARSGILIDNVAQEIVDAGGNAIAITSDVSSYQDVEAVIKTAMQTFGNIDVLVNNAGTIIPITHLATADPANWGHTIDVNLKGVFHGMRAALPHMKAGGTIITISSGAAHNALEGWSAYCTSKAGAAMLTMAGHKEHADQGIRFMGLSPGLVATDMQVKIRASGINPVSQSDPETHRSPETIANVLLWMCSDAADEFLGLEVSLHNPETRAKVGLIE